jgi:alpha-L-rhamnosidase
MGALGIGAEARRDADGEPREDEMSSLIHAFDLRCESLSDPLGVDARHPRLSWKLKAVGSAKSQSQSAYQISVASSHELLDNPDIWDSGKVRSNQQLHVEYEGRPLSSGERCYWRVEVWDRDGDGPAISETSWWEMGLLSPKDWQGVWISDGKPLPDSDEGFYEDDPAPLFRKSVDVVKSVKQARLYAAGLGYSEFTLNGKAVSDHVLDPAWTSTEKRVFYTCHDVTELLGRGENVIGATLGNGWHNPLPLRMWGRINIRESLPVARPQLLAQLVIDYTDGSREVVATDETWKVTDGPLRRNSVYMGEDYDARLELPGWDKPGFDAAAWSAASVSMPMQGDLRTLPIPPIRITKELSPVSVKEISEGVFIFDFGQNFAGWAGLRVQGPAGTTVKMRMGELVYDDGRLNPMTAVAGQIKGPGTGGPGAPDIAWQENNYTLKGGGPEEYRPRFTFHGFRYVEVTGFPGPPTLGSIQGYRLNTDVDQVGYFECSNENFNRIQEVVEWTFLSNLFSVQSDCPAREKYGYGGDIVASSEMAIFNYDVSTFYAKAVTDFTDAALGDGWFTETAPYVGISAASYDKGAGPIGWGLAHPLLLAQLYQYYGDHRLIEEHFAASANWVDLLEKNSDGYIIDRCIGDHESLDRKDVPLMATAQFYQAASLVAGFADVLRDDPAAARYQALAGKIRAAFLEKFLEPGTGRFGIATQACQSCALELGLTPEGEHTKAVERMVQAVVDDHGGHVATGIFGTKYLLNALSVSGHGDVAYEMANQKDFPGWINMLDNGATTLWETWKQSDNTFSQNHPMFGSVSEWFFKCLGGIRPAADAVGFDKFVIEPFVGGDLEWVNASYESVRGMVSCRWRVEDGEIDVEVEVPVNTEAVVALPGGKRVTLGSGRRKFTHQLT